VVTVLGFVVVLVALRLLIRRGWIALSLALLLFVSVAMPRGELVGLNLALAGLSTALLLGVLMRVGLLAAMTALIVHYTLQSNVLTWELTTWPGDTSWLALAIVLGLAGVGCWRALAGRTQVARLAG
jgi:uncharacterized membrane protein